MQVSFLFWNVYGRSLETRIARIAATHSVDVLMLAECPTSPATLLAALNASGTGAYCFPDNLSSKIKVFTRFPKAALVDQFNDISGRLTIRRLRLFTSLDIYLCIVHLASKVNYSEVDQLLLATEILKDIHLIEGTSNSSRFLLVGDFNMNPFESGMVAAQGFHAMMTKQQARKVERTVQERSYRYFYNPMWGHFGDRTDGPGGTYHRTGSQPIQHFWNIYDQVLLRPSLMDSLARLDILTTDGADSLLTDSGLPRKSNGSDHLPLLFRLDL